MALELFLDGSHKRLRAPPPLYTHSRLKSRVGCVFDRDRKHRLALFAYSTCFVLRIENLLSVMSRLRLSEQLKVLQVKQQQLNQQVVGLAAQKRALRLRQAVLSCWCDALTLMQLSLLAQPDASLGDADAGQLTGLSANRQADLQSDAAHLQDQQTNCHAEGLQFRQLLQQEVQLLQRLASSSTDAGSCQPTTLEQLLQADDTTISIYSDPMQYLYQFLDRPPMPEAATMTGLDAATIMSATVQRLSIQLHQLQSVSSWEQQQGALSKMKDTWDR